MKKKKYFKVAILILKLIVVYALYLAISVYIDEKPFSFTTLPWHSPFAATLLGSFIISSIISFFEKKKTPELNN